MTEFGPSERAGTARWFAGLSLTLKAGVFVNRCTPPDEELCPRCAQLFEEESRRRLGAAYSLLIDLARRRAAEKRAEDGETTAG